MRKAVLTLVALAALAGATGLLLTLLEQRAGDNINNDALATCTRHTGSATITRVDARGRPYLLTQGDRTRPVTYLYGSTPDGDELMTIVTNYQAVDCATSKVAWVVRDRFSLAGFEPVLGPVGEYTNAFDLTRPGRTLRITLAPTVDGHHVGAEANSLEINGQPAALTELPAEVQERIAEIGVTLPEPAPLPAPVQLFITEQTISFRADTPEGTT